MCSIGFLWTNCETLGFGRRLPVIAGIAETRCRTARYVPSPARELEKRKNDEENLVFLMPAEPLFASWIDAVIRRPLPGMLSGSTGRLSSDHAENARWI
jgi:hypothetical protein